MKHGLRITITIDLKKVNFLDVTLNLEDETYKPYRKPGDRPLYVHSQSNHPPQIIKNIPMGIEKRLIQNSCNEKVFEEAIPDYQKELDRCGYKYSLKYQNPERYIQDISSIAWLIDTEGQNGSIEEKISNFLNF